MYIGTTLCIVCVNSLYVVKLVRIPMYSTPFDRKWGLPFEGEISQQTFINPLVVPESTLSLILPLNRRQGQKYAQV